MRTIVRFTSSVAALMAVCVAAQVACAALVTDFDLSADRQPAAVQVAVEEVVDSVIDQLADLGSVPVVPVRPVLPTQPQDDKPKLGLPTSAGTAAANLAHGNSGSQSLSAIFYRPVAVLTLGAVGNVPAEPRLLLKLGPPFELLRPPRV